jgi:hypothetical protein
MQNTFCKLYICNSNPMVFNFQQISQILLELFQMILCQTLIVSTILRKDFFLLKSYYNKLLQI